MTKPTAFPPANALTGSEILPIIQAGVDSRSTLGAVIAQLGVTPTELADDIAAAVNALNLGTVSTFDQGAGAGEIPTTSQVGTAIGNSITALGLGSVSTFTQGAADGQIPTGTQVAARIVAALAEYAADTMDPMRVGGIPYRPGKMDLWFAALANARTTPANVVVFGDSVAVGGTEGNLTTALPYTYWLESVLNRYVQLDRQGGYVPGALTAVGPHVDQSTGGSSSSQDFANKAATITGAQFIQHHFDNIDQVSVVYRMNASSGTIRVRDGGVAGTVIGTINANAVTNSYSNIWTSAALTPGAHDIYLDSNGGGGTQFIAGLYGHNGNGTKGVRVWPAAKSGATSETSVTALANGYASALMAAVDPDLVVYATGFNDNVNYDTFMRSQLDTYMPLAPNASHVLLIPYILPTQGARWDEAQVALAYQIAEDYDLGVIDQSIGVPDMSVIGSDLLFDSTHPDANGSRRLGLHAGEILAGDPLGNLLQIADVGWTRRNGVVATQDQFVATATASVKNVATDTFGQIVLLTAAQALPIFGVAEPMILMGPGGAVFPTDRMVHGTGFVSFPTQVLRPLAAVASTDAMLLSQRTIGVPYGTGADGDLVNSGTLNLTRDMQWANVSGTGTINPNGWRVSIRGTLSGTVSFAYDGVNGAGAVAGTATLGWYTQVIGGAGGTGAGTGGGATSGSRCLGAVSGVGGLGSGGAGGVTGYSAIAALSSGVAIADISKIHPLQLWNGRAIGDNASPRTYCGGGGGGGGGGDGASGGGGGSGGGVIVVYAYDPRTWTGGMSAIGGNGGNGAGTNCGGGGGGGGGLVAIIASLGVPTAPGARTVTGGTGGAKTGTGVIGSNGGTGTVLALLA